MIRKPMMSFPSPEPQPVEPLIDAILNDHFENHENPHETLYRIWLLINARTLIAKRVQETTRRSDYSS